MQISSAPDNESTLKRDRRAKHGLSLAILSVVAWLLAGFPCEDVACPGKIEMGLMALFIFGTMIFVWNADIGSTIGLSD